MYKARFRPNFAEKSDMKKMKLLSIMGILFALTACTKDGFIPGDSGTKFNRELNAGGYGHCGEVIQVAEPNGEDDTQSFIDAFEEAVAAGPGSLVQLAEGTYIIGFVEVRDFVGCFVGAGKGKSVITSKPDLPCDPIWGRNLQPALIRFTGGDITIRDMTYQIEDGSPCESGGDLTCILSLSDFSGEYIPEKRQINCDIKDVEFIGGLDEGTGIAGSPCNVIMAVYCGSDVVSPGDYFPLSTGNVSVTDCYFENCICGPDAWAFDKNSVVKFENNVIEGGLQQIFVAGCMGTKVSVKGNNLSNGTFTCIYLDGFDFWYYPGLLPEESTRYVVTGNTINCASGAVALYIRDLFRLADPLTVPPQLFDIRNNVFVTEEGTIPDPLYFEIRQSAVGIEALNVKDALITNNLFKGTGTAGIFIDGYEDSNSYAEGIKLLSNDFRNADYSDETVYLGPYSKDCNVVGVSEDDVVDDGVNNLVIGAKMRRSGKHLNLHLRYENEQIHGKPPVFIRF